MKMEKRRFVDLLLKGELEAVTQGLEDGLFSWEELDQPHDDQGFTPLMSACQMGLHKVMHFLLEKGADPTLCNQSNQTALHVSHPDLQKALLAAMLRPLAYRGQLFEVAWRGDIQTLQCLLSETDSVDVNIQNQNGLTPLMLAVRDVDLFEPFKGTMGWDYDPTKVAKTLLAHSANMDIQDRKSCTVLTYVRQIKSSVKDELLQIILEYRTQSVPAHVVPEFHFPAERCNNPHSLSSPHPFSTLTNEVKGPYACIAVQEDHKYFHQDKIIALCFRSAMEPKTNSKSNGWTTFPSVREKNKCWTKFRIVYPNSEVPVRTSLVPIPPRLAQKTKAILESPPVPHFSQLSQSAPSLSLLDASFLLQVRTNIHNRLSTSDVDGQREPLPVLCPRTPKHLAPLDQQYRDGHVLSNFHCPLAPKLNNLLSFGSKETRDRFSRLGSRASRGTGRGSEESSYSSQSSLDEEEEDRPQETGGQMSGTIQREPHIVLVPPSSAQEHLMNSGNTERIHSNKPVATKSKFVRCQKIEAQLTQASVTEMSKIVKPSEMPVDAQEKNEALEIREENRTTHSAALPKTNKSVEFIGSLSNEPDEPKDTVTDNRPAPGDGQSCSFVDTEQHYVSPVNIALHPAPAETSKASKMTRDEEIKRKPSLSKQTINILDQINMRQDHGKLKRNGRNQSSQDIINETGLAGNVISEETSKKLDWPKRAPIKHGPKVKDMPLNCRRTPDSVHQGRLSGTKKISNKPQSQKQLLTRDTNKTTRPAKRPGIVGTQKTKLSPDYVSYRDMFLEIHQADEGPAIFEMFATPIYANLRAGSCVDRPKQVQSAPQFKRQQSGRYKAQKPMEGNRRKHKCTTSKGRQRKRKEHNPPESQSHDRTADSNQNNDSVLPGTEEPDKFHIRKPKFLTTEGNDRHGSDVRLHTECSPVLSMIREVPSDTDIWTAFHNQQGDLSRSFQSHRTPNLSLQFLQLKTGDQNNIEGDASANVVEDSLAVQLPSQPLINTWTTQRTKSPVFQRFLDEVGEGPVTDDLLKRLAEELISLEEREVETLKPENPEMATDAPLKLVTPLDNLLCTERSSVDETITWSKGEILGRGAYGTVYCGLTSQGRLIAVKQVTLDASNPETAEKEYDRLEREVDLLKNLHHQNIVGFLGTALSGNVINILMEYIPGGSISNVLNRFGPLPEKVFALYTRQILEGVVYLHANRVIHRDLKGNNMMLMPSGVIKLIDFGCARRLNCLTHSASRSDLLKSVHGTPYWMAPEVINETGHGKKSDIWSIGCTVFEMATGKPPLAHMGKMAALFYIGAKKGLMPSLPDDFSEEAKGFVQACLINDQNQRPSASDLLRHPFVLHLRLSTSSKPSNVHH